MVLGLGNSWREEAIPTPIGIEDARAMCWDAAIFVAALYIPAFCEIEKAFDIIYVPIVQAEFIHDETLMGQEGYISQSIQLVHEMKAFAFAYDGHDCAGQFGFA